MVTQGGDSDLCLSKEDWVKQGIRERAQGEAGFDDWKSTHPIQARIWLAYCEYADRAFEAMFIRWDLEAFTRHVRSMRELASWISKDHLHIEGGLEVTFRRHFTNRQAEPELVTHMRKYRRPGSNQWHVLLALEQWE